MIPNVPLREVGGIPASSKGSFGKKNTANYPCLKNISSDSPSHHNHAEAISTRTNSYPAQGEFHLTDHEVACENSTANHFRLLEKSDSISITSEINARIGDLHKTALLTRIDLLDRECNTLIQSGFAVKQLDSNKKNEAHKHDNNQRHIGSEQTKITHALQKLDRLYGILNKLAETSQNEDIDLQSMLDNISHIEHQLHQLLAE